MVNKKLKNAIKESGKTIDAISLQSGVSTTQLKNIIKGDSCNPTAKTMVNISKAVNTKVDDLGFFDSLV
ncbi:MAG: helix-turn-helix domain-containing protein [Lentisphaeraceae bacterium]|nr:helix-turn-helix domain-containing protein [Lentisphaeraceae bacterium]